MRRSHHSRHSRHSALVPLLAAAWFAAVPARPARGASDGESPGTTVALVAERAAVEPGRPFTVALRMKVTEGWHTYWKNPGDGGLPVRIEWKLPRGFVAGAIEWPAPRRIPVGSLMCYGYAGEFLLPIVITPPARIAADSVTLAGTVDWLECKEACVPGSAALVLSLPVRAGAPGPGPLAAAFAEAGSRVPGSSQGWAMAAEAGPRAISLTFRPPPGASFGDAYLFVDRPLVAEYAKPQGLERAGSGYRLTLTPAPNAAGPLDRLTGVLVLEGSNGARRRTAVRVDLPVSAGDPSPIPARGAWLRTAAFSGGLGIFGLGLALLARRAMRPRRS